MIRFIVHELGLRPFQPNGSNNNLPIIDTRDESYKKP